MKANLGDFAASTQGCLGENVSGTTLQYSLNPKPGEGFWFLLRALYDEGHGTYDTGDTQVGVRDDEINGALGSCLTCAHAKCKEGGPLHPTCDPCVDKVCQQDSFCCNTAWDAQCVREVRTVCGSLTCDESMGSCTHTLCTTGAPLQSKCDSPPAQSSCVEAICQQDPGCCQQSWGSNCVSEVSTVCGKNCD